MLAVTILAQMFNHVAEQPTTKQELYDRIRGASKDEVILEEMIRLGYWPSGDEMPNDPADEIRRLGELSRELRKLATEKRRLADVEALKKQLRIQRLKESKQKRKERKQRILQERAARAEQWKQRKKTSRN